MIIGAIVYKLRALKNGRVPEVNGRLMHGVFFTLLHQASPSLAKDIHESNGLKPFTVSELKLMHSGKKNTHYYVKEGDPAVWRITLLHELLLRLLLNIPPETIIDIGGLPFKLEAITADSRECHDAGSIEEKDLIAACLGEERITEITLTFRSPTTFRQTSAGTNKIDYPFPLPSLVFSSLCEKWNLTSTTLPLSSAEVSTLASLIIPKSWHGQSQSVYFGHDRGVRAFTGSFTYDLSALSLEERQLILLLSQFAVFAGTGRLTAQGFGSTTITYK